MNQKDRAKEPLELKYKLIFFFTPFLTVTTIIPFLTVTTSIGADFTALGYTRKEKQKWNYIGAGFCFYAFIATLFVKISTMLKE